MRDSPHLPALGTGAAVLVAMLVGASALLGSVRPACAQVAHAPDVEEQTVLEQLENADVGDAVGLVLFNQRSRPTGIILQQSRSSIQLLRDSDGIVQVFDRRFVYAVVLREKGVLDEAQAEEAIEQPEEFARPAPKEEPAAGPPSAPDSGRVALGKPDGFEGPFPDASRARLLFAPTARAQESGQLYVASHELIFPYAALGIDDVLDLRAGISIMPNTVQFIYGGAKVGVVQRDRFHVAVGGFGTATTNVITVEGAKDEYGGVAYALSTIGAPDAALTVGAGYLAAGGSVRERALALLGGEYRFGDSNVKLLTENYVTFASGGRKSKELFGGELFAGDVSAIASVGVRIISERTAADLGVVTSSSWWDATVPVVPLITLSYNIAAF